MSGRAELLRLVEGLVSLPTAPFHEQFVSEFLRAELGRMDIEHRSDEFGNIIAGPLGPEPAVVAVAHMDHPGFEIAEGGPRRALADWFGGVAPRYFIGSRVVVYRRDTGAARARGVITRVVRNSLGRVERMHLKVSDRVEPGDFGTWDLIPFRRRGERIDTKGADDLVGCAVILAALKELKSSRVAGRLAGFFTRAEEQGFIGTLGMIRQGTVSRATKIVSIETSKALPGVVLGGGPVIRLGDRTCMFDHRMVLFMSRVAEEIRKTDRRFFFQRRVMDGGTCEATPYQMRGFSAGGIAIPLYNYHNQGRLRVGPEGVHLGDVEGAGKLLVALAARIDSFEAAVSATLERFESAWRRFGGKLTGKGEG